MTDTRIPADILEAARAVVDRAYDEGLIDTVARALLAERERCALIADQYAHRDTGYAIAAAIRNSHPSAHPLLPVEATDAAEAATPTSLASAAPLTGERS